MRSNDLEPDIIVPQLCGPIAMVAGWSMVPLAVGTLVIRRPSGQVVPHDEPCGRVLPLTVHTCHHDPISGRYLIAATDYANSPRLCGIGFAVLGPGYHVLQGQPLTSAGDGTLMPLPREGGYALAWPGQEINNEAGTRPVLFVARLATAMICQDIPPVPEEV